MITRFVLAILAIFMLIGALAQDDIYKLGKIDGFNGYYDNPVPNNLGFAYASDSEAEEVVRRIMSFTNLSANFRVMPFGMANAQAIITKE